MTKVLEDYTKDELIEIIKGLKQRKKFGLVWEEKPEEVVKLCDTELPVLEEVAKRAITEKPDGPTNLIIEGDNYHSLSALNYTHAGKVDVIYIDPPYNTESKDFRYNDKYIDKEDTYRHSKWLSFMGYRLRLSKHLLNDSGVVLISINENELFNLKLLCDEIFNPDNYLTCFTVKVRHEDRILKGDKDFHEVTEYLLMYRKSSDFKTIKREKDNTSDDDYLYKVEELTDNPQTEVMGNKEVQVFKPEEYRIKKVKASNTNLKKINIRGSIKEGNSSGRFYMANLERKTDNYNYLYKVPNMGGDRYDYRYFQAPSSEKRKNGHYYQGVPVNRKDIKYLPYPNYVDFEAAFNNVGYEGGIEFRNGKKPLAFLEHFFELATHKKDALFLDYFAGSGSTAEAVMRMNKDGGNRRFILCTNNENKIAEEVTYPRIKNVVYGYDKYKGIPSNARYFQTSLISKKQTDDQTRIELVARSADMICIREDTFDKVLDTKYYKVFGNSDHYSAIVFEPDVIPLLKDAIAKLKDDKPIHIYVFSLSNDKYASDFADLQRLHELRPIPESILEVYRRIFKDQNVSIGA
jgi:adenine-specific DNA-methyltransferase